MRQKLWRRAGGNSFGLMGIRVNHDLVNRRIGAVGIAHYDELDEHTEKLVRRQLSATTPHGQVVRVLTFDPQAVLDLLEGCYSVVFEIIYEADDGLIIAKTANGHLVLVEPGCAEDCEARHCKRCEQHYFCDGEPDRTGLCNDCELSDVGEITKKTMGTAQRHGVDPYKAVDNLPWDR